MQMIYDDATRFCDHFAEKEYQSVSKRIDMSDFMVLGHDSLRSVILFRVGRLFVCLCLDSVNWAADAGTMKLQVMWSTVNLKWLI
jgi:hypothetical protein